MNTPAVATAYTQGQRSAQDQHGDAGGDPPGPVSPGLLPVDATFGSADGVGAAGRATPNRTSIAPVTEGF